MRPNRLTKCLSTMLRTINELSTAPTMVVITRMAKSSALMSARIPSTYSASYPDVIVSARIFDGATQNAPTA